MKLKKIIRKAMFVGALAYLLVAGAALTTSTYAATAVETAVTK